MFVTDISEQFWWTDNL